MNSTPPSLLERVRSSTDQEAWNWFVRLYTPLLYRWVRRLGLQGQDADDLIQDVFTLLIRKLPEFRYDPRKRFRNWLYTVTVNRLHERRRGQPQSVVQVDNDVLAE